MVVKLYIKLLVKLFVKMYLVDCKKFLVSIFVCVMCLNSEIRGEIKVEWI